MSLIKPATVIIWRTHITDEVNLLCSKDGEGISYCEIGPTCNMNMVSVNTQLTVFTFLTNIQNDQILGLIAVRYELRY